ncbi:glycoside hydrolase family 13 protein [Sediminitomix flava]|uniref:Glycosidase n=1 Tax=Sediminitomix flava TaxID=379075 RepID=A0A315Z7Q2_SEDFL|nr:glycoside hydrolase family 13 protein [Sediminitomix flava]PWJ39955.1 glycosidase [Sediminitomix flava]
MKNSLILLLSFFFMGHMASAAKYQIDHLEPSTWWVGMKNPKLQLLVHGENISELRPEIKYDGVTLDQVSLVENPNYMFIDLTIAESAKAGKFEIVFTKSGKKALSYTYELLDRAKDSADRIGFNNTDVMYLITPDRFANGDPSNDSVDGMADKYNREDDYGRHGGDIQGMIDHLDYIEDMGYTALWVNPMIENDMPSSSYHGYAITDFYQVDARFGSNEDYKKLADACDERGIKLIMDMIMNHCGSEHWWMKDLPTSDWLNFQDGFKPTNHKRSVTQDPYASKADTKLHFDGWFVETMPDMNQRNPFMATYLIQNTIWWVEYAGLEGIRMDTYPYPDQHFMADWTEAVMTEYPEFNIVGEEWTTNPALVAYWQRDKKNANGYTSELPSLMDFPIQDALAKSLNSDHTQWGQGFNLLYEMQANDFLYADPYNLVVFPDNHDMDRIYTQLEEDYTKYKLAIAYMLTTRGIPQIYYGTEILMSHMGTSSHGALRADFPGGWEGDKVNAFTGEGLDAKAKEAQDFNKKLTNWRKTATAIHDGKLTHFAPAGMDGGSYVYFRYDDNQKVMVVLNMGEDKELYLADYAEVLDGETKGTDVISGKEFDLTAGTFTAPAGEALVLELK